MSDVESLSHSAITVSDVREAEQFYETVMNSQLKTRANLVTDALMRGRPMPHSDLSIGDWLFAMFPHDEPVAEPGRRRGTGSDGSRHAFAVSHKRFDDVVQGLRDTGVQFEGPIAHPEQGPLGESVYFAGPGVT